MPITPKRKFGDLGEKIATNFLKSKGYEILDKNFQNNFGRQIGEIDIVARDPKDNEIVFVEVKAREYKKYKDSLPEENITYFKLTKLSKIANVYLRQRKIENSDYRFDAISIWLDYLSRRAKIKHIKNI